MKFEEFKKEHQGKHFCKLCGAEINITHQHIYVGIPAFCSPAHHKKWDAEQKWQRFLMAWLAIFIKWVGTRI